MKRGLIGYAAILSLMIGCQTSSEVLGEIENNIEISSSDQELVFNPAGGKMTKVDKDATAFDTEDDDFGVFIYAYKCACSTIGSTSDATELHKNAVVKYSENAYEQWAWRIQSLTAYWPSDANWMLNTFAYSPYDESIVTSYTASNALTITAFDNTEAKTNLMGAITLDASNSYDGSELDLKFYRALSQLRFNIALNESTDENVMVTMSEKNATSPDTYTADNLFPKAAADFTDDAGVAKVYTSGDIYLQEIKVVNIPTKGDCTISYDETNGYTTTWDASVSTTQDYIIYKNASYTNKLDDTKIYTTDDDEAYAEYREGMLLTTLVEGDQTEDDYGWVTDKDDSNYNEDGLNPFFRPLIIPPFATNNTSGVNDDLKSEEIDAEYDNITANQPYVQFTYFIDVDGGYPELVVARKPLSALASPNSRITYDVTVGPLYEIGFTPSIQDIDE